MGRPTNPVMNPDQLISSIEQLSSQPFRHELARILQCAPTDAAIQKYANKFPDRWAKMVKQIALLAGYQDKSAVQETNIYNVINLLPDSALVDELKRTLDQLGKGQLIEGEKIAPSVARDDQGVSILKSE